MGRERVVVAVMLLALGGWARGLNTTPTQTAVNNTTAGGTPRDVAVDPNGVVFVTTAERQLYAMNAALGDPLNTVTLPGSGAPVGLVATTTNVFVALSDGTIVRYTSGLTSPTQGIVTGAPVDLTIDPNGNLYVATSGGAIHKLTSALALSATATYADTWVAIRAQNGSNIYAASSTGTIRLLSATLGEQAAGTVSGTPLDITSDASNVIVATTSGLAKISSTIGTLASASVTGLVGVDMDTAGHVAAATSSGQVLVYNTSLGATGSATTPSPSTTSIAMTATGTIYIVGGSPTILWGDPHIVTVDGVAYDYQGAGEFVFARSRVKKGERAMTPFEIQTRHAPVPTGSRPGGDAYTGIPVCVSVATAVAVRVGSHRVTYQRGGDGMQVRIDGVVTVASSQGVDLGGGARVVATSAGIEIDSADGGVVFVTPGWWEARQVWYLNISLALTRSVDGLAGPLPEGSWLPALPDGSSMGPKPEAIHDRFVAVYGRFGEAWRITQATSLFDYAPGESTTTFTKAGWPSEQGPCDLGTPPPQTEPIPEAIARQLCAQVPVHKVECVFDVMATGDAGFATTYALSAGVQAQPRGGGGGGPVPPTPPPCTSGWCRILLYALIGLVVFLILLVLRYRARATGP